MPFAAIYFIKKNLQISNYKIHNKNVLLNLINTSNPMVNLPLSSKPLCSAANY